MTKEKKKIRCVELLCSLIMLLMSQGVQTVSYPLPPEGSRLMGSPLTIMVPLGSIKPLEAFAAQYEQGLNNMLEASPGVDVFLPESSSTPVVPQQLILPDTVHEGIVINVVEMWLYYYPAGSNMVGVLSIGVGQAGRGAPRNWVTAVEHKREAPDWTSTSSTRREYATRGENLPAFVPAGPENPMSLYAIYIGRFYAIHGTNANFSTDLRVSQGCIRLQNDDIKHLFDTVPVGTRVQLTDQPVKYSEEPDDSRWVEIHKPLSRNRPEYKSGRKVPLSVTPALHTSISGSGVDVNHESQALERCSGMPMNISLIQKHYWFSGRLC